MNEPSKKPFFVGYLDMPRQLKRFYLPVVLLLVAFAALASYTIASQQKSTGQALWLTDSTETISGLLVVDPYPVLHRIDPDNPQHNESILLVNQGKISAHDFARPFHNKMVSVTGYPILRGGWRMHELVSQQPIKADEDDDNKALMARLAASAKPISLGAVRLSGEVVDSKCFLGVMKPGAGAVHKACAEVCLLGGIPAMLLVRGEEGKKYGYMLIQPDGSSASKAMAKRVADSLEISGELQQRGDLLYIKRAENGISG